jgi:hypothetical protein
MSDDIIAPASDPFDVVLLKRRQIRERDKPELRFRDQVVLKQGPRASKVATHWEIWDRHTGALHHHAVTIDTYNRTATGPSAGWTVPHERSITLTDEHGDELRPLSAFLAAVFGNTIPSHEGDYLLVPMDDSAASEGIVRELLDAISAGGKATVIAGALATAKGDPDVLRELAEASKRDPESSRLAAAALTVSRYTAALEKLERLIEENALEREFQKHLTANQWIFGSEYSELLDNRHLTRDENQDLIFRRTVDGYVEIIEFKRPHPGVDLFVEDASHQSLYPRSEVTEAVGQVIHYIEEIEANRHMIMVKDQLDTNKIRAKIIIGRSSDERQLAALRTLNGHLHRIEFLTFDQLLNIGRHVLRTLHEVLPPLDEDVVLKSSYPHPDESGPVEDMPF